VFCRFSLVIQPVFGKFNRKAMKRAAVQTGNKTFNNLAGNQTQVVELVKLFYIKNVFHCAVKKFTG
jgi:hypothetical protein